MVIAPLLEPHHFAGFSRGMIGLCEMPYCEHRADRMVKFRDNEEYYQARCLNHLVIQVVDNHLLTAVHT